MNIVIEGFDNAGKSTLAKLLSRALGRQVHSSEGPEKEPGELMRRVNERYAPLDNVIFDRHPCVSDPIYSAARGKPCPLDLATIATFYTTKPLFIYCDAGTRGLYSHVKADHDTPEHLAMIESHHQSLLAKYRQWAIERAHITYRIGEDPYRIIDLTRAYIGDTFEPMRDVERFMVKFGQYYKGAPRMLPEEIDHFRIKFMEEELKEYLDAPGDHMKSAECNGKEIQNTLEQMLDSLIDLTYVVLGTAQLHGFDFREAWKRVHNANMKKVRATSAEQSTRHSAFDVVKPEGWVKPDHSDLVAHHIHKPVVSQR